MNIYIILSILIVLLGSLIGLLLFYPLSILIQTVKTALSLTNQKFRCILDKNKPTTPQDLISFFVYLSKKAWREGVLSLEEDDGIFRLYDQYTYNGLILSIDGIDPKIIEDVLSSKLFSNQTQQRKIDAVFQHTTILLNIMGVLAFFISTILIFQFEPETITFKSNLTLVLIGPLLGLLLTFFVIYPIRNRLQCRMDIETLFKIISKDAILLIQTGYNPRILEQKLMSYINEDDVTAFEKVKNERRSEIEQRTEISKNSCTEPGEIENYSIEPKNSKDLDEFRIQPARELKFEDLARLDGRALQIIFKYVDYNDLAIAIRSMSEVFRNKIFNNVSTLRAEMMKEEEEKMGNIDYDSIQYSQSKILYCCKNVGRKG